VLISTASVTDAAAMRALVSEAERELGAVDILVNNAGIGQHLPIEDITLNDFQRMFDIHVKGSFFCGQAVIPGMKARNMGRFVNISSIWRMVGANSDRRLTVSASTSVLLRLSQSTQFIFVGTGNARALLYPRRRRRTAPRPSPYRRLCAGCRGKRAFRQSDTSLVVPPSVGPDAVP